MSWRLTAVMVCLLSILLLSLGLPLAREVAEHDIQQTFSDRQEDASRFASEESAAVSGGDRTALTAELARYDNLYGITVMVLDVHGRTQRASRPHPWLPAPDRTVVSQLLTGRQPAAPKIWWPWNRLPLATGEPMLRNGEVIGAVVLMSPTTAVRQRIRRAWSTLGKLDVLALGIVIVLARTLTRWVLRPVRDLAATTARVCAGDLDARSEVGMGPPELRSLATSFNEMVHNVQDVIDSQSQFVADASHQLRNPLSALLIRLEALVDTVPEPDTGPDVYPQARPGVLPAIHSDARPDPSRRRSAELAVEAGRSLAATLDTMLALARASGPAQVAGAIDVSAVIDRRVTPWRYVAQHRGIDVVRDGLDHQCAHHDPDSLHGAFDAVMDNAIKFSAEGSVIVVSILREADRVLVRIVDQGPGLLPEELPRITDRFWRSRRDTNVSGSGLGMSIAARLLERQGGLLRVLADPGGGLRVELVLRA